MSDLRGSGHIEEDADTVLFLYRESKYFSEEEWRREHPGKEYPLNITEAIIDKQRQGDTGKLYLYFDKENQRYRDVLWEDNN